MTDPRAAALGPRSPPPRPPVENSAPVARAFPRGEPGDLAEGLSLGLESLDLRQVLEDGVREEPVAGLGAFFLGDESEDRIVVNGLPRKPRVSRDIADL